MTKSYPVALVGESNYQHAIASVGEGEDVLLWHEPDNPYDPRAIAAVCHGDTIGYLPQGHWLGRALLDEGKGVRARIGRCERGASGLTGVRLLVSLDGEQLATRMFEAAPNSAPHSG